MSLFEFSYEVAPAAPPAVTSNAVPIGVVSAAAIAGVFSLVTLIISKENKISEFRQAWIDAQRVDVADLLAWATAFEAASDPEKKGEALTSFDRCFARILLRDNPDPSTIRGDGAGRRLRWKLPSRKDWAVFHIDRKTARLLPWGTVTSNMARLRNELCSERYDPVRAQRFKRSIVSGSRRLLKNEWTIVKNGEHWYATARAILSGFAITTLLVVALLLLAYALYGLFHA